jgi:hypothetical protein
MKNAKNDGLAGSRKVIDCVLPAKYDPQIGGKQRPRRAGSRELGGLTESAVDLKEKVRCDRFGGFFSQVAPDFG